MKKSLEFIGDFKANEKIDTENREWYKWKKGYTMKNKEERDRIGYRSEHDWSSPPGGYCVYTSFCFMK